MAVLIDAKGGPAFRVHTGDVLSIHAQTGEVFVGSRPVHGVASGEAPAERHAGH